MNYVSQDYRQSTALKGSAATIELMAVPRLADTWTEDTGSLVSQRVLTGVLRLADAAVAMIVGLVIALLYVSHPIVTRDADYALLLSVTGALTIVVFQIFWAFTTARATPRSSSSCRGS